MKKLLLFIVCIVCVLVVFSLFRDQLIKSVISAAATRITGARVEVGGFSMSIFKQSVRLTGFKMHNPEGFSDEIMVDLPAMEVDMDLPALLRGKFHLEKVSVHLKEIGLEKNKEGVLNVDSLTIARTQEAKGVEKQTEKTAKSLSMQIDLIDLEMGRLIMRDYSGGGQQAAVNVYDINLKKSYKDITSAQQLAALILAEPMKQAGIKGAGIYGAALLTGVAFLPAAAAITLAGKDSVEEVLKIPQGRLYDEALEVVRSMGEVKKEDKASGVINAGIQGAAVAVTVKQETGSSSRITISARKFMLPKPEIASGVLYEIKKKAR